MGRIVETEAYDAVGDAACHTWFRPSARTFVEAGRAGDAYVYMNYGVHWLFNVLVKGRSGVSSSAYSVRNASDDFPDPLGPVITTSFPRGMSHLTK